jgi:glutaredoxin 3
MCPHCESAKSLLKSKNIEFEERKISEGWTKEQLLEAVPNARSVPQIILDGKYIGTYDHLKSHFEKEGK